MQNSEVTKENLNKMVILFYTKIANQFKEKSTVIAGNFMRNLGL